MASAQACVSQHFSSEIRGRILSPLGTSLFFFQLSRGLVRPTTPWRLICFTLSPKTASVLSHTYRMPTQHLNQHLSSTPPPPTQDSHTSAHFLISHFGYCLLYPWSDLHRSSEPQVSPSLRSLGSRCEPSCPPMAVFLSQLPSPETA